MNVEDILIEDLREDLRASLDDIALCERCLALGVTHHRDGFPVEERLKVNSQIVEKILMELRRRGA